MSNQKSKIQVTNNEAVATTKIEYAYKPAAVAKLLYQHRADIEDIIYAWLPSDIAEIGINLVSACLQNTDELVNILASVKETKLTGKLIQTTLQYIDCCYVHDVSRENAIYNLVSYYDAKEKHYLVSRMMFGIMVNLIYDARDNSSNAEEYMEYIIKELKYMFCPTKSYEIPVTDYIRTSIIRKLYKNINEDSERVIISNTILSLAKSANKDNIITLTHTMLSMIILKRKHKNTDVISDENGKVIKRSVEYKDNDKDIVRIECIIENLAEAMYKMNINE